jgi:AAA domain
MTEGNFVDPREILAKVRAKNAAEGKTKPATNGAGTHVPGLEWQTLKDGMHIARWTASVPGYKQQTRQLWSGLGPTEEDRLWVARESERLQAEMLAWERTNRAGSEPAQTAGGQPEPPPPDSLDDYGTTTKPTTEPTAVIDLVATFTFLGDAPATAPRELIKKLLPAYGVAVTGGQPSAGKTFIEMHKALCLAKALPFFGRKIVERVGTAFVAAEGRALIPNRFAAALAKELITEKLPIAWINQLPDFSSADGIKLFIRQLRTLDERFQGDFGVRLGQVPIDTVAASFGMKDEDDNAEATKVCNIMRTIGDETGALVAPVHHYSKNPESGLRGASAWKGSADVVMGVLADIDPLSGRASNRELVCAKARDGEQGPISPFELERRDLRQLLRRPRERRVPLRQDHGAHQRPARHTECHQ